MTADPTTAPRSRLGTVPTASPALELTGLSKVYPGDVVPSGAGGGRRSRPGEVRAIDGVDLTVPRGEMFGLLGPNGAGKSTTVGVCTTRIRPTAGDVRVEGVDAVADPARVKRRIGVVTQDNTLDRSCTLRENLLYHCRYYGWTGRASRDRADELLERFRLTDRAAAFPDQISGGMAQRLQVARAIAHRPSVLFLDEPTAGLDPQSRIALWELVEELRQDGLTVVLTTHYMEEAESLCDRVAIIDHGRLLVDDTPERLITAHGTDARVGLRFVEPPSEASAARIAALTGVEDVQRLGHGLRVRSDDREGLLAEIVAATAGADLVDVSRSGSNLEAVFIALTGRDLRE